MGQAIKTQIISNGGDKITQGWLTRLHEYVLTLSGNTGGLKECPQWTDFWFSSGSGEEGIKKVLMFFSPTSTFFFLLDAVVIGPELQLQGLEAKMISKQKTVIKFLTFMSEFLIA